MRTIKRFTLVFFLSALLIISACTKNDTPPVEEEDNLEDVIEEETTFEIDLDVKIEGLIQVADGKVIIDGKTNAPPGSRIHSSAQNQNVAIANFIDVVEVKKDGTFHFEFEQANEDVHGMLTLSVSNPKALEAYGYHFENVTSNQRYETNQMDHYEIRAYYRLLANAEQPYEFEIEQPEWERPEDYGERTIWLTTEATVNEKYIIVEGQSNFIEGTMLHANVLNEKGMIEPLSFDQAVTKPDGTFTFYIPYQQLKPLTVVIEAKMSRNASERPIQLYGKSGELLEGDFVKKDKKETIIEAKIPLSLPTINMTIPFTITFVEEQFILSLDEEDLIQTETNTWQLHAEEQYKSMVEYLCHLPDTTFTIQMNDTSLPFFQEATACEDTLWETSNHPSQIQFIINRIQVTDN